MKKVNAAECREIIQNHPYVVLKFGATWCPPCKTMARQIDSMRDAYPNIRFLEIDTDDNPAYAAEFGFNALPSLFFAAHGSFLKNDDGTLKRIQGAVDASLLREEFTRLQNILVSENQQV